MKKQTWILSTGGTGGHIFPALALADFIKENDPNIEILFVGAQRKMEMEKIPKAGYPIIGLPIAPWQRPFGWRNFLLPFLLLYSFIKIAFLLYQKKPQWVIGFGSYASFVSVFTAQVLGFDTALQEQNAIAGLSNKILAKKAKKIAVAFEGLGKIWGKEKVFLTGNPIRKNLENINEKKQAALDFFGFSHAKKTLLIVGGSQGAWGINRAIFEILDFLMETLEFQILWQAGKSYFELHQEKLKKTPQLYFTPFIEKMDLAYAAADIIVSRAGALALAELACVQKPTILVPFPHAAHHHQLKNAQVWETQGAAICIEDKVLAKKLPLVLKNMLDDPLHLEKMKIEIGKFARPDATKALFELLKNN